ncbi:MAG: hypothetical protein NTZ74_04895 [Chloroflexi bacterium]|nr:hypothetical protein [Chloroflexota bacterium]
MGKRKLAIEELDNVIEMLDNDEPLDVKYCDHPLQGDKKTPGIAIFKMIGFCFI